MKGGAFLPLLPLLFQPFAAEKIVIHEIREAQQQFHPKEHKLDSPFLSATLKTRLSPVGAAVDARQLGLLSAALVAFYQRVFEEQNVYDVEIVGVAIFEESLVSIVDEGREGAGDRKLALNELQATQFHFRLGVDGDEEGSEGSVSSEDYYYDYEYEAAAMSDSSKEDVYESGDHATLDPLDDSSSDSVGDVAHDEEQPRESGARDDGGYALTFATVVSAAHTDTQYLSHADFQKMLTHISHKFASHMVEYVREIEDGYFANVESVEVSGYEQESSSGAVDSSKKHETEGEETQGTPAAVIVALGALGLLVVLFILVVVKKYRKGRQKRWRAQEIATSNIAPRGSPVKSLQVLYRRPQVEDDYSFDPLGTNHVAVDRDVGSGSHVEQSTLSAKEQDRHRSRREEECISFENPISSLFARSPSVVEPTPHGTEHSHALWETDENDVPPSFLARNPPSPRESSLRHAFAPPGKVGVAIDVVDGRPVVHKVRRGSPLEGVLLPNDRVLAVDHVDTTRMSAADVTQLMAQRMDYNRRITFAREVRDC